MGSNVVITFTDRQTRTINGVDCAVENGCLVVVSVSNRHRRYYFPFVNIFSWEVVPA